MSKKKLVIIGILLVVLGIFFYKVFIQKTYGQVKKEFISCINEKMSQNEMIPSENADLEKFSEIVKECRSEILD